MTVRLGRCEIRISPLFAALVALLLVCDRTGLVPLSLAAILLHECGHLLTMRLIGRDVRKIDLKPAAVEIGCGRALGGPGRDAAVAASGALANFIAAGILLIFWNFFPFERALIFAALSVALGVFSLLPVAGLDGGDLLLIFLSGFLGPDAAYRTLRRVSLVLVIALFAAGAVMAALYRGNPSLLLCGLYLLFLLILSGRKGRGKR